MRFRNVARRRLAWSLAAAAALLAPTLRASPGRQTSAAADADPHRSSPDPGDAATLVLHARRERTVEHDVEHAYQLTPDADTYVELRFEQLGVDLTVSVHASDGATILKMSKPLGPRALRLVSFVVPAGRCTIGVRAADKEAAGRYAVTLEALRAPTADERRLDEARRLAQDASDLIQKGRYDAALAPATRALELREAAVGPADPLVADSLHVLADYYDNKGNYKEAEPVNERALSIRETRLGPDHPDVAKSLFNLAWIYLMRQDYAAAEASYQRALAIQERVFGTAHRDVAATLNDLAILYHKKGEYEKAIEIDVRVLAVRERIMGPSDVGVALTLNNLGLDYVRIGDYARAESSLLRALAIYEKTRAPDHPDIATTSNNLGMVYFDKGDYAAAERFHLRALEIDEKTRGPNHAYVGAYLTNLALLYERQGDYAKAGPLWTRALAVRERALGPNHSDVGEALSNLANFHMNSKTAGTDEIESMLQRSLGIIEKAQGSTNDRVAGPLTNLAKLYAARGEYERAEAQYQRALTIRENTLGPTHPTVAQLLARLADVYQARGKTTEALAYWSRYSDVQEKNIDHNLPTGSDRQKLSYVSLFAADINDILSFHARSAPDDPAALRLAATMLLRRKGRALDAEADTIGLLRRRADAGNGALFASLSEWRTRLAAVTLRGPERDDAATYRSRIDQMQATVEKIEAEISARSAAFRAESRPVTLEAVQAVMPADAALIEFAQYRSSASDATSSSSRYAAYIVFPGGAPRWVDLGEAAAIDHAIDDWRRALRDPKRLDVDRLARAVDERVMRPVRATLGDVRRLLISPDGLLNVTPFAALVDEDGTHLVERYSISYLTSGRDLLRLQVPRTSQSAAVVVADPAFGDPAIVAPGAGAPRSEARIDYSQMFFGPLPGVNGELRALRTLLPGATFLTRQAATKTNLMRVKGPTILHVATHGFFLRDVAVDRDESRDARDSAEIRRLATATVAHVDNPLLRSGLALAGANASANGSTDGVLTALEAADLDLWGTQLVVLSACDTGVGEIRNGEGVYGLRRALVLAGSESQMMSLWPVSDASTRDLIVGYYESLLRGAGRGEALRLVQLKMLHASGRTHPYYWASFILSGRWTDLERRP